MLSRIMGMGKPDASKNSSKGEDGVQVRIVRTPLEATRGAMVTSSDNDTTGTIAAAQASVRTTIMSPAKAIALAKSRSSLPPEKRPFLTHDGDGDRDTAARNAAIQDAIGVQTEGSSAKEGCSSVRLVPRTSKQEATIAAIREQFTQAKLNDKYGYSALSNAHAEEAERKIQEL